VSPARPQPHLRCRLNPAIVRDVNHQCVFGQATSIKRCQQFTAGLIKPLAHRMVFGQLRRDTRLFILLQQPSRRIVRCMRQHRCVPDKKWLLSSHRPIHEFQNRRHTLTANLQTVIPVTATLFRKSASHACSESAPLPAALPPFSRLQAGVTGRRQQPRQRRHTIHSGNQLFPQGRVVLITERFIRTRIVSHNAVLVSIPAGQN